MMTFASQHLEYWKEKGRKNPQDALHILRWYDVKAFAATGVSSNSVEIILNSLIGALNNRPKLPHTIVVMLGDTKFWCDAQTLKFTMDTIIKSMLKEIKRIVQIRQRDLPLKAVGQDPAIFFVKLNWKPEKALESVSSYPKKRRTFNKLLDSIVRPRGGNTILLHEINGMLDEQLFLSHGDLSEKGYRQIWQSLSEALEDFETLGHQKKKEFAVLKQAQKSFEVDSSMISSEDDDKILFVDDTNPLRGRGDITPRIQNKRRFNKNTNLFTQAGHRKVGFRPTGPFGQSFFHRKF